MRYGFRFVKTLRSLARVGWGRAGGLRRAAGVFGVPTPSDWMEVKKNKPEIKTKKMEEQNVPVLELRDEMEQLLDAGAPDEQRGD